MNGMWDGRGLWCDGLHRVRMLHLYLSFEAGAFGLD